MEINEPRNNETLDKILREKKYISRLSWHKSSIFFSCFSALAEAKLEVCSYGRDLFL